MSGLIIASVIGLVFVGLLVIGIAATSIKKRVC